jgi:hypothetical protein
MSDEIKVPIIRGPTEDIKVPVITGPTDAPGDRTPTERLFDLYVKWENAGDYRAAFANLHGCISKNIGDYVASKRFKNGDWVNALNGQFISRFEDALSNWEKQQYDKVAREWKLAFSWAEMIQKDPGWGPDGQRYDPKLAQKRVTVLMAGAHILHDIKATLKSVGCKSKEDYLAVMPIINHCEAQFLGPPTHMIRIFLSLFTSMEGVNAIEQWRNAVWAHVCEGAPDPTELYGFYEKPPEPVSGDPAANTSGPDRR